MRIDVFLVEKGFCNSRNKAKDLLLKGGVKLNGVVVCKSSVSVNDKDVVEVEENAIMPYVSKGGLKLEKAIVSFNLDFKNKTVLDIGASTGGFTDCALKHGAKFVWAVDVGSAQLVQELKEDKRVSSLENTDFRELNLETIGNTVDIIVGDLSFISLKHIVKHTPQFLTPDGYIVLLIKPQFEVGVKNIDKGGIVKSPKVHLVAINEIVDDARSNGLFLSKLTSVPIVDEKKNIEYLALFKKQPSDYIDVNEVVRLAFIEKLNFGR
ncbi:MAG TPA: TlyA family rRNA (cytidine-2'-O)-methyltransferase [Bacteroidales bacterium]|nr:TlyA family rRNA (cytidine-2'-O)-methyltransferase [Bacteroidales bacterium]